MVSFLKNQAVTKGKVVTACQTRKDLWVRKQRNDMLGHTHKHQRLVDYVVVLKGEPTETTTADKDKEGETHTDTQTSTDAQTPPSRRKIELAYRFPRTNDKLSPFPDLPPLFEFCFPDNADVEGDCDCGEALSKQGDDGHGETKTQTHAPTHDAWGLPVGAPKLRAGFTPVPSHPGSTLSQSLSSTSLSAAAPPATTNATSQTPPATSHVSGQPQHPPLLPPLHPVALSRTASPTQSPGTPPGSLPHSRSTHSLHSSLQHSHPARAPSPDSARPFTQTLNLPSQNALKKAIKAELDKERQQQRDTDADEGKKTGNIVEHDRLFNFIMEGTFNRKFYCACLCVYAEADEPSSAHDFRDGESSTDHSDSDVETHVAKHSAEKDRKGVRRGSDSHAHFNAHSVTSTAVDAANQMKEVEDYESSDDDERNEAVAAEQKARDGRDGRAKGTTTPTPKSRPKGKQPATARDDLEVCPCCCCALAAVVLLVSFCNFGAACHSGSSVCCLACV